MMQREKQSPDVTDRRFEQDNIRFVVPDGTVMRTMQSVDHANDADGKRASPKIRPRPQYWQTEISLGPEAGIDEQR
jgi:hypothetical protein